MNAKELRIGNYIIPVTNNNHELEPRPIMASEFLLLSTHPEKATPVKLEGKWLEKAGFKKYKVVNWYSRDDFWDIGKYDGEKYIIEILQVYIKYVHQLQNIYYDVVGKELEFN